MKPQFLFCAILLLGIVGMESLKEEQIQHLWSSISGYSLPVAVLPAKYNDLECPSLRKKNSLATTINSDKKEDASMTCFLLYNPGKNGFRTCQSLGLNSAANSNIL